MKRCFACGKKLGKNPNVAVCEDEQIVHIGSECYKQIGKDGWNPPAGGPKLYRGIFNPSGILIKVVGLKEHPSIGIKY